MRTYVIFNTSELGSVDFDQVLQDSADTLRYSLDGSKALLKYEGGGTNTTGAVYQQDTP